jgi:hypothetical protein
LVAQLAEGTRRIPLVERDAGRTILGNADQPLRVAQCSGFCVAPGTLLALPRGDGRSALLTYEGASDEPDEIYFSDERGNDYVYKYAGKAGAANASANVVFDRNTFAVRVGPYNNATRDHNISIDLRNPRGDLVLVDGTKLRITLQNASARVDITIPARGARKEETVTLFLNYTADWSVRVPGIAFVVDDDAEDALGQTVSGTTIILDQDDPSFAPHEGSEALLLIPDEPVYGIVRMEG